MTEPLTLSLWISNVLLVAFSFFFHDGGLPFRSIHPRDSGENTGPETQAASYNWSSVELRPKPPPSVGQPSEVKKVKVLVAQSHLTLCDPMDYSPPGSVVHGILQA